MHVLLAFDKFKDALDANQACDCAAAALRERHPAWTFDACPLTDGGDGFAGILTKAAGGEIVRCTATGPRGEAVETSFGIVAFAKIPSAARALLPLEKPAGRIAVVELASASGLARLKPDARDPWQTTTFGTGELLRAAAAQPGVGAILLGVGGSATNDLGLGVLAALGLEFHTAAGEKIHPPVPVRWKEIATIAGAIMPGLPPVFIACDVRNVLLGQKGAAGVYGPQKGLRPEDLRRLENESAQIALMLCGHCRQPDTLMDVPGTGAAGGTPFGLIAALNALVLPGSELVSAWLDLDTRLAAADVVVTGEGRFDDSSLTGKGPGAVVAQALAFGLPVHVFAGEVSVSHARHGLTLHPITPPGMPLATALSEAPTLLATAIRNAFQS
ncbi:MAG TPA: glycerate kinase [Opitutaceae bacterium]|nr:glycerate kinase [Opitutaceae bacterium]